MAQLTYRGATFDLSDAAGPPSVFVLGVRKSGSSILNSMVHALSQPLNLPFIDIPGKLFAAGVKVQEWRPDPALCQLLAPGQVYGGFRNAPLALRGHSLFEGGRKILLVRDPRDALVSEYFSNAYSHSMPAAGEGREQMLALRTKALRASIESFVIERCGPMRNTLMEYAFTTADPLVKIFRYEDIIGNKAQFLMDIAEHFDWTPDLQRIGQIVGWADVQPSEERPTEFVRRVTPGDHRDKLSEPIIAELDRRLAEPMLLFGYAT